MITDLSKIYEAYSKYTKRRVLFESNDDLMDQASKPVSPEEAAALEKECRDKFLATYLFLRKTHPFFAVFSMKCSYVYLPPGNSQGVNTMAVTYAGTTIMINTFFGAKVLDQEEFDGVIAHEVYHIMSQSLVRIGSRTDHKLWNIATDYIMNLELVRSGIALPSMGLVPQLKDPANFQSDATADISFIIDAKQYKDYLKTAPKSAIKDYIQQNTNIVPVSMPAEKAAQRMGIPAGIIPAAKGSGNVTVDCVLVDITKMTQENLYDVLEELSKFGGKGGGGGGGNGPPGPPSDEKGDGPPGPPRPGGRPGGPPRPGGGEGEDDSDEDGKGNKPGKKSGEKSGPGTPGREHGQDKALRPGVDQQPLDQHIQDAPMTKQEVEQHAERIRRMVDEAKKEAARISNVKDPLLDQILDKYPPPPIDWKRLINAVAASPDYTTTQAKPARSTYGTGAWVGRIIQKQDSPVVYFLIDSSGSMIGEIPSLVSAITDFIKKIPNASIRIIFWDAEVSHDSGNIKYSSSSGAAINKVFDAFKSAGSGGTVISCVRAYFDAKRIQVKQSDSVIYITDADVADPTNAMMIANGKKSVIITKTKQVMQDQNEDFIKTAKKLGYNVVAAKISKI